MSSKQSADLLVPTKSRRSGSGTSLTSTKSIQSQCESKAKRWAEAMSGPDKKGAYTKTLTQFWENKLGYARSIWPKPEGLDESVLTEDLNCLVRRGEESFCTDYDSMIETCRAKIASGASEPEECATIRSEALIESYETCHQASLIYKLTIGDCSVKKDEVLLYNLRGDQIDPKKKMEPIKDGRGRSLGSS